jgi:hypothetical protein
MLPLRWQEGAAMIAPNKTAQLTLFFPLSFLQGGLQIHEKWC